MYGDFMTPLAILHLSLEYDIVVGDRVICILEAFATTRSLCCPKVEEAILKPHECVSPLYLENLA